MNNIRYFKIYIYKLNIKNEFGKPYDCTFWHGHHYDP
jgi:hypothetical protein